MTEKPFYCECADPIWKVWTDGATFCTRCGFHQKPPTVYRPGPMTPVDPDPFTNDRGVAK